MNVKTSVLDSHALVAFFEDEEGASVVEAVLKDAALGTRRVRMCLVNWGELYYITLRVHGREILKRTLTQLQILPVEIVPADEDLTRRAAEIKASHRLSYADSYVAALAERDRAEVVTGDPEFAGIEKKIPILWIRKAK